MNGEPSIDNGLGFQASEKKKKESVEFKKKKNLEMRARVTKSDRN